MSAQIEVWKWAYMPFTLGGSVYRPVKTTVDVDDPIDIGGGYKGYLVKTPSGKTYIAEASCGAIVGSSIEQVRDDIENGDPDVMRKQVADGKQKLQKAKEVPLGEFFR